MSSSNNKFRTSLNESCVFNQEQKTQTAVADGYYDAVYLYGQAVHKSENPENNTELLENMKSKVFQYNTEIDGHDETQRIVMDENGDQKVEFSMYCLTGGGMSAMWRKVSKIKVNKNQIGIVKSVN